MSKSSIWGSLFKGDSPSKTTTNANKVDELIKSKAPASNWIQMVKDDVPADRFVHYTTATSTETVFEDTKPDFLEVISEYNDTCVGGDKNTLYKYLMDRDDPQFGVHLEFMPRQDYEDKNKYTWEYSICINLNTLYFRTEEEANIIYDKIKEMVIGKGNNYIQIDHGVIRALTIPTSKKKKKEGKVNDEAKRSTRETKENKV